MTRANQINVRLTDTELVKLQDFVTRKGLTGNSEAIRLLIQLSEKL